MSRQRIRTGVLESSSEVCPVCAGSGRVRAVPSVALHVLRMIEENLLRNSGYNLNVRTSNAVALYILNQKRGHLRDIETRFGVEVTFTSDEHLAVGEHCIIARGEPSTGTPLAPSLPPPVIEAEDEPDIAEDEDDGAETRSDEGRGENGKGADGENGSRRRRRRRRGRGGRGEGRDEQSAEHSPGDDAVIEADEESAAAAIMTDKPERSDDERRGRRRGRRGGRRNRGRGERGEEAPHHAAESAADDMPGDIHEDESPAAAPEVDAAPAQEPEPASVDAPEPVAEEPPARPARSRSAPTPVVDDPNRPKRAGWWNKLKG
jgi:ribonuclease E